jgi:hypothetical protein
MNKNLRGFETMRGTSALAAGTLLLLIVTGAARAADGTLSLTVENDSAFDGSDRHYTSGLYVSRVEAPRSRAEAPRGAWIADHLMLPGDGDAALREGWFFGQSIFTPENLLRFTPDPRDRPYAGWLFGGLRLYRDSGSVLDRADVTLGVVGPASLGSDLQKWWHAVGLFGGQKPQGWHAQLRGEPGLVVSEQRTWRVSLVDGPLEVEALPEANFALGNIFDYAGAGLTLRLGQGLASDWGPPRVAPAQQGSDFQAPDAFGWYLYAGLEGRLVGRNLFLDGNSFQAGPSVGHETLVGDFSAGAAMLFPALRADFSYTRRSREFPGQRGEDQFASVTLSFAH